MGRTKSQWVVVCALVAAAGITSACGDSSGSGGGTSTTSSSGSTGAGGAETKGCGDTKLLANPDDTSKPGPWPVGAKTVKIGNLTAEIWYPAKLGSEGGVSPVEYDIRSWLPASEMGKIADAKAPKQSCACFRDLPIDDAHGPYPVVLFVHGTAGFRTQSLDITTHWASRGFVVVAADHPGLDLTDLLGLACGGPVVKRNLDADLAGMTAALGAPAGDLAFLQGHVDMTRLAMAGHSAGGQEVSKMGDAADVLIPMAADAPTSGTRLQSTLVLGAQEDKVVPYTNQQMGYANAPPKKRLVGISPGGHLTFASLCSIKNADGQDIVTIGKAANVCGLSLASGLFDCLPTYLPAEKAYTIVDDASSGVLEETLQCASSRTAWLAGIAGRYPEVIESKESL